MTTYEVIWYLLTAASAYGLGRRHGRYYAARDKAPTEP